MPTILPHLPKTVLEIIRLLRRRGSKVYLVGGAVRDWFLKQPTPDWDIAVDLGAKKGKPVVEKEMFKLLNELCQHLKGRFVFYRSFLTGTIILPDETKIDIGHTRCETYAKPATLPRVEPASIEEDLARRDFTINAFALELTPHRDILIDPFQGQQDLHLRLVRIIHPESFIDDPTRIFRALRFAIRLDYRIESGTIYLLRTAVKERYLSLLTPERILYELRCILAEPSALKIFESLRKENILQSCWQTFRIDRALEWGLKKLSEQGATPQELFCYLLSFLPVTEKFPITTEESSTVSLLRNRNLLRKQLMKAKRPSTIYHLLKPIPELALRILIKLERGVIRNKCSLFQARLRYIKPETTAVELMAMGIPPGPALGALLKRLHEARLDEKVNTKKEELQLLKRWKIEGS
ncbi:MAG: CCA tRNA nucleotidyltransferase [bacterium]